MSTAKEDPIQYLSLDKLIDIERLQRILDRFATATGLALIAIDVPGNPVTAASSFTPFCQLMRKNPKTEKLCMQCDAIGGLKANQLRQPFIYRCHSGLIDFSIPISLASQYLGAILCGQVELAEDENNEITNLVEPEDSWRDDPELQSARKTINTVPYEKVKSAAYTLDELINYLLDQEYERYLYSTIESRGVPATTGEENQQSKVVSISQAKSQLREKVDDLLAQMSLAIDDENLVTAQQVVHEYLECVFISGLDYVSLGRVSDLEDVIIRRAHELSKQVSWQVRQCALRQRASGKIHYNRVELHKHLCGMLVVLFQLIDDRRPRRQRSINTLLNQIECQLSKYLSASEAAKYLNVSQSYFTRVFKEHTGMTYQSYVTERRIEQGKFLLTYSNYSVTKIASLLGFQPINYFSRVFKKGTGQTPTQYRSISSRVS